MLWKLIRCVPKKGAREAFAASQEAWRAIRREPGFGGQCGGWTNTEQEEAWVLGLWQDRAAQERFLEHGSHDAVVGASGQLKTLESWSADLFEQQEAMPGEHGDLKVALDLAPPTALLRLADCHVPKERQELFRQTQTDLWLPAMAQAEGMLGGGYAWDGAERFLVATLWRDTLAHRNYATDHLPRVRAESEQRGAYPEQLTGLQIPLETRWMVHGKRLSG
ncbi:MAG: DUF4937 domain-containing protein [Planctomycetota bacterium]